MPPFAAALVARAEKLPFGTDPPLDFAVADWIRAAAVVVIGVEFAAGVVDFVVIIDLQECMCRKWHSAS